MTKRHTRLFFIIGTLLFSATFVGLTIDSHRQFGKLTNADKLTPQVIEGKHVWHRKNCINCHTLMGEGAYYAPDLTKITQQRGAAYLTAFLKDPSQFYSEEKNRRLMPNQNLTEQEIKDVISFLDWVSNIDTAGWPPRPIVVSSGQLAGAYTGQNPTPNVAVSDNPIAQGEAIFRNPAHACATCHSTQPGVVMAGPSLAGIGTRAAGHIGNADYKGKAKDAAGYIHESIVEPSAHLVPGATFSAAGTSFMPPGLDKGMTSEQLDQLVAYLSSLR